MRARTFMNDHTQSGFLGWRQHFGIIGLLALICVVLPAGAIAQELMHAPFWRIGGGFESSLVMNNSLSRPLDVNLLVYNNMGRVLPTQALRLEPLASVDLNLGELIGVRNGFGNIALRHSGNPLDVAAQVVIRHLGSGLTFNAGLLLKSQYMSSRLEGVADLGSSPSNSLFAFTNTTDATRTAQVNVKLAELSRAFEVRLGPHETRLLSLAELLEGRLGRLPDAARPGATAVGLSVEHDGGRGDVLVHGLMIAPPALGTNMHITDPAGLKSNRLLAPALRLTAAQRPLLALRDLGRAGVEVVPTIHYKVGESYLRQQLSAIRVPPSGIVGLDLSDQLASLPPQSHDMGLGLQHSGNPGALLAELLLVDSNKHAVVQATPKDTVGQGTVGMSFAWRLDGDSNTVITVANPSATDEVMFCVFIIHEDKSYTYTEKGKFLKPGQVMHVDIRHIRDQQIRGEGDATIPRDAVSGQAQAVIHNESGGPNYKFIGQAIHIDSGGKTTGF